MRHWTEYLPEAGQIVKVGRQQAIIESEIEEHIKSIDKLKEQFGINEEAIYKEASKYWTAEEIHAANYKARGANINNIPKIHPVFEDILKIHGIK